MHRTSGCISKKPISYYILSIGGTFRLKDTNKLKVKDGKIYHLNSSQN